MSIEEVVYNGRDNTIALSLYSDGALIAHNSLTRCQVNVGGTVIDSSTNPSYFDFTHTDRIIIKLGLASLSIGEYLCKIYVYDAVNTHGICWGEFTITVTT